TRTCSWLALDLPSIVGLHDLACARLLNDRYERAQSLFRPFVANGRQEQRLAAGRLRQCGGLFPARLLVHRVDLTQRDDFRLVRQAVAIGFQFPTHDLIGLGRILFLRGHKVQQNTRALDMAEEAVPYAYAFMRAFDQAGNVGDDELARIDAGNAKVRVQRREGIVGYLRLRRCHGCEEGRLAGIGKTHEPGIRDQLQSQPYAHFNARLAGIGPARRLVGRALEMLVAEAAIAALGKPEALANIGQVADQRLVVLGIDLGSRRHLERHVRPLGAGHVAPHAVAARPGLEVLAVTVVDKRIQPVDRLDPDIAPAPAVAAIRPSKLDEFLTPERYRAGAAVAGTYMYLGLIE